MSRSGTAAAAAATRIAWWFEGPLLAPIARFAGAVLITVGPWIVSVAALAVVSITMTPLMGGPAVEDLRLAVVYAFLIAPLVAGPIGTIAARLVRSSIEERSDRLVLEIFRAAALGSGMLSMAVAGMAAVLLGIAPLGVAVGFIWMTAAAALLWTTFAILSALGLYRFLIVSFSSGMLLAVFCTLAAARIGPTAELLVWCFTAGMSFCVALAFASVSAGYRSGDDDPGTAFWLVVGELGRNWRLALGIGAAIATVWADKVVFWFGPDGMRSAAGFLHCAPYDSVMFVAHLSAIPSLSAMLLFHDGPLRGATQAFRAAIARRSTYDEIRSAAGSLARSIWTHLFTVILIQASCAAALILMAPVITDLMGFSLIQFDLLRIGIVTVFLQSLLFLSCGILIICQCVRTYCLIQVSFLALNLLASIGLQWWLGLNGYAVFISSMAAAVASSLYAYRALSDYEYLFFVGENDSLYRAPDAAVTSYAAASRNGINARIAAARAEWNACARSLSTRKGD